MNSALNTISGLFTGLAIARAAEGDFKFAIIFLCVPISLNTIRHAVRDHDK